MDWEAKRKTDYLEKGTERWRVERRRAEKDREGEGKG